MHIAEKTVLITGANRGIGEALVKEALNRGAKRVFAGTRGALPNTDPRVTALTLDVTNASQIQRAVDKVAALDVLINNAGIAIYDDLTDLDVIQKQLDVNFLGLLKVTQAFLPLLTRSKGAVVNNLSLAAITAVPVIPSYSISKAAALSLTQSLRALLKRQGVGVHAVILGSIDTDMNRAFDGPKASTEFAAVGIFDGLEKGEEDIFPDPISRSIADGWRAGVAKALERQINAVVLEGAQIDIRKVMTRTAIVRKRLADFAIFRKNGPSGGSVATDDVDQGRSVTFLRDSKFFFTLYHAGKVNIILHVVSFSFLFYGLTIRSVSFVLIGLFIFDEMGHAYNYFFVHNQDPRFGLRMIPYQLLYASLIMPVLLKLFGWF